MFLGYRLKIPNLGTFQVWDVVNGENSKFYYLVRLLDPDKDVKTVEYTKDRHKLENVDPDTHFSISESDLKKIIDNPSRFRAKTSINSYSKTPKLKKKV